MKSLVEYIVENNINEAGISSKDFFKDWKKILNIGAYPSKWYGMISGMIEKYGLEKISEDPTKTSILGEQTIMTVLYKKGTTDEVMDVAITRPGKSDEIDGLGTVNQVNDETIDSKDKFKKWLKGRKVDVVCYKFQDGFFDKLRSYLSDKLMP